MSRAKQASKRKSRACAVPLLGAAGLSLSLASGASAATGVPATDMPTQNTAASHEITFGEEEIADVSLATFYVFDKENRNIGTRRTSCLERLPRLQRLRRLPQRLRRLPLRRLRWLRRDLVGRLRRLRLWRLLGVGIQMGLLNRSPHDWT